jgi:hypothetical protein
VTTARFNVFIDGARAAGPGAKTQLARAIAARYGIAAADLEQRFAQGRFRVKGNVDRATADSYVADLSSLGAVCSIEAVDAPAPPAPVAAAVTLPGAQRLPAPRSADDFAALSGESPLTLSTLDGASEDEARSSRRIPLAASFGPPAEDSGRGSSQKLALPASFGPPAEDSGRGSSQKLALPARFGPPAEVSDVAAAADDGPIEVFDPFAPPELQSQEPELALAVERKPRISSPAPAAAPAVERDPPGRTTAPAIASATLAPAPSEGARAAPARGGLGLLRDDVVRYVAGVVLAVALAAIPALLFGASRQRAAFADLDAQLDKRQAAVVTREDWEGLDRIRASVLDRKRDERQTIVVTTLLLWAALAGGLAWVWFRKVDWDRLTR